jgi:hypothetical protein
MLSGGDRLSTCGFSALRRCGRHACERGGERYRARVVHQRVDSAERIHDALHGRRDRVGVAHVELKRERLAAGRLHFLRDAVDRALETRMGLGGLAGHDDPRSVARAAQSDLAPDAAACPRDEDRLALE